MDTGIDLDHPWLAGKLVPGYDFVDNDPDPTEEISYLDSDGDGTMDEGVGHGTHVAGVVALAAPGASIMPVRIFDADGVGRYFDIVQGIVYAVEHGADVINLSGSGADDLAYLHNAVIYAQANDVVVIAAGGINVLDYPASYAGVVAVGAVDAADYPQPFAVYTGDSVTVYAPGASTFSAYYNDSALYWSGNSMATPFVAAGAALVRATGACDAACVYNVVQQAAYPVQKEGVTLGYRIDLYDMVTAVTGSSFDVTALYQVNPTDTPNDDSIQPFLQLQNNGRSLPWQEITVRYWYQTNTAVSEQFHCDYVVVGCTHLLANFVPVNDRGSTNHYLELSFTPAAGYLLGGRSSGDMMVRTNPIDHSVYDELTHYTYNAALTTYTPWEHVTVYYHDTLIWGIEPPMAAATCTTASWNINQIYIGGDQAAHNGRLWHAKWWTQGEEPGTTGQWGVWEEQGTCP